MSVKRLIVVVTARDEMLNSSDCWTQWYGGSSGHIETGKIQWVLVRKWYEEDTPTDCAAGRKGIRDLKGRSSMDKQVLVIGDRQVRRERRERLRGGCGVW